MLGVCLAFGFRYRSRIPSALRDYFGLDMWVFVLLVAAFSALPMVDWAGHLGGFLWGLIVFHYGPSNSGLHEIVAHGIPSNLCVCRLSRQRGCSRQ